MVLETIYSQDDANGIQGGPNESEDTRFSALQASMLTEFNRTDPAMFPDELVRKAWLDADKQPGDWPALRARHGIHDGHLMNLAHEMVGNQPTQHGLLKQLNAKSGGDPSAASGDGEEAQPYVPDAANAFPKLRPISGAVDQDQKGRINSAIPPMGYIGATPPGQFADGFTQMPGNGPHPYEGMNDWQYTGRVTGENLPGWDSGRQAYEAAKRINEKRERGEPVTDDDLRELGGYGVKAAGELIGTGIGGAASKGIIKGAGRVARKLF